MPLSTADIAFDVSDLGGVDFDARRTKVYATANTSTVVDTDGNHIFLGSANATVGADGTGTLSVPIPGAGSNPESWQTSIHVDYPDRNAPRGRTTTTFGPFTITADANLADLVAEMPVQPEYASDVLDRLDALEAGGGTEALAAQAYGYENHGDVSGSVTFDGPTASHRFSATAPTTITLDGYDEGMVATLICFSGADDVTVVDAGDVTLVDGTAWSAELAMGAWISGGGGGEPAVPDTTPPSAVADLAVTPDDDGVTAVATFTAATDAESTVKYRYRLYPTGGTVPAWPTSGSQYSLAGAPINLTGLTAGEDYTMELQAYSAGGSAAADTATFTTPTPAGWNAWDSIDFADPTAGTFASPRDFTTDQGRTLRATSDTQIIVGSGKVKGEYQQAPISMEFPSATPPNAMRVTAQYELVGTNPSYGPKCQILLTMQTGNAYVIADLNPNNGGATRRLIVSQDYGTGVVLTAGPGYTLNGSLVEGIPASGVLAATVDGQVLSVHIDGALILSANYAAHVYNGNPSGLVGAFSRAGCHHDGAFYSLTWETYS